MDSDPSTSSRSLSGPDGLRPLLRAEAISKQFPGVLALDRVDFDLRQGEVHVLFGENGAGKSTLISIIAGALRQSGGRLLFKGRPIALGSVHEARALGDRKSVV